MKIDTTYWIYEVVRCHNSFRSRELKDKSCLETENNKCEWIYHTREDGKYVDPECASEDQIDKWIKGKTILSRVMD